MLAILAGFAIVAAVPSVYESTMKIYVSPGTRITNELTSGRRSTEDNNASIRGLRETVFSHNNMVALIRDARLVQRWPATRTWALRLVDLARTTLVGPVPAKEAELLFISLLERAILVGPEDSASIRFRVYWRDPESARTLTRLAVRNFLSARKTEELAAITRATTLLEDEQKRADAAIEPAVAEMQVLIAKLREKSSNAITKAFHPTASPPSEPRAPMMIAAPARPPLEITNKLEDIRREQRAVSEPWQRRAAEVKFQLAELRAIYGPEHPLVVQQEAKVRTASQEPSELVELRRRESELMASVASAGLDVQALAAGAGRSIRHDGTSLTELESLRTLMNREIEEPELSAARSHLDTILRKSQEVGTRLDAARIELASAQAGFAYRYSIIEPAQLSRKPVSPNRMRFLLMALVAGLALGFAAGAARELLTGRIVEPWQIKRLGVNVLAEVELRPWRSRHVDSPPS